MINSFLSEQDYSPLLKTHLDLSDSFVLARLGTKVFVWSGVVFIVMTIMAYVIAAYLPFSIQILAHIGMLVSAGTFKLGYIMRLLGQRAAFVERTRGSAK